MNRAKFHVKKGDQVQVISGNHKGATGKILAVLPKKERVLVEGVRLIKRHIAEVSGQSSRCYCRARGPNSRFKC